MVAEEPYEEFRARVRETFAAQGWRCISSDEEADFFVRGRWEIYAVPALAGKPQSVTIWEFPTETSRRSWDARVEEEADKATIHRAFSAESALDLLREIDPGVVRGS